jgi:hypothetical protein
MVRSVVREYDRAVPVRGVQDRRKTRSERTAERAIIITM